MRARLLLGIALCSILALAVALGALASVDIVTAQAMPDADRARAVAGEVYVLRADALRQLEALRRAALLPAEEEALTAIAAAQRSAQQSHAALRRLRELAPPPEAQERLDQIERLYAALVQLAAEAEQAHARGAPLAWLESGQQRIAEMLAVLDEYAALEQQQLLDRTAQTRQQMRSTLLLSAGAIAAAVLAGAVGGAALTGQVRRRLGEVTRVVRLIAASDFTVRLPPLGDDEVGALAAAINQLADSLAEGRARLEASAARLVTVNEAAAAVTSTLQLDELVSTILDRLTRVVAVQRAAVFLNRDDGPVRLASRHWTDADDALFSALVASAASPLARGVVALPADHSAKVGVLAASDRTFVAQPLIVRGQHVGFLALAAPPDAPFDDDDCRAIALFGAHVAAAIHNARLYEASKQAGVTEERSRLAREIHDTLAQGLSAIILHLEAADALLDRAGDGPSDQARQHVRRAGELARANLDEARRSLLDLRAAPLEGLDLPSALQQLAQTTAQETGIPIRFEAEGAFDRYPARVEAGLYRIAQEALANAVRHAAPSAVTIRLVAEGPMLHLTVADDGRGFDPDAVRATGGGGFGITGMRERAALLGGTLAVESRPHAGTRILVTVPSGLPTLARPPVARCR
ncbi:MAG: histidine kinase [Chloroflexota bacterium]|nr:histidine kinase [Chloroflexota bacterium]